MTTGTVRHVTLEGGFFGIETEDGENLFPINLPDSFKRDGLKIRFQAEDAAVLTISQWGRPVRVRDVSLAAHG